MDPGRLARTLSASWFLCSLWLSVFLLAPVIMIVLPGQA
jgi:hypothetical protein